MKGNLSTYEYDDARRLLSAASALSEAPADESGGEAATFSTYDEYGNRTAGNLPGSTSVNILANSTFENDPFTTGNGWDGEHLNASWTSTSLPYMGAHYVSLSQSAGELISDDYEIGLHTDDANIDSYGTYAVSALVRGDGVIKIYELNEEGNHIGTRWPVVFSSPSAGGFTRVSGLYWPDDSKDANGDQRDIHSIQVVLYSTSGQVDFDNVRLEMATSVGGENYCDNASFEIADGEIPATWHPRYSGYTDAEMSVTYDMAVSGARSAKIELTDDQTGYFYGDWIPVDAGDEYSMSGHMKTVEVDSSSSINIMWWDASKDYLSRSAVGQTSGTTDWRRYVANVTAPTNAAYARFEIVSSTGSGITYFDAMAMERTRGLETFDYDSTETFQVSADSVTGHRSTVEYDGRGRVTEMAYETDPGQDSTTTVQNEYDDEGRLESVTSFPDALTGGDISASYTYSAAGRLLTVTDPLSRVYQMDYDVFGRLKSVKDPLGYYSRTLYDGLGRVDQVLRPSQSLASTMPLSSNFYDSAGRLSSAQTYDASGTAVATSTVEYDKNSNVTTSTLSYAGDTWTSHANYDVLNRPYAASAIGPAGNMQSSVVYDDADLPTSSTWTVFGDTNTVENEFAKTNEWKTTRLGASKQKWYFAFDIAGRLTRVGGGIGSHMRSYDAAGRFTDLQLGIIDTTGDTAPWANQRIERDGWERVDTVTTDFVTGTDATDEYHYDAVGRLDGWTRTGVATESYGYDLAGNLISRTTDGVTTTYQVNAANQITTATVGGQDTAYEHDEFGRLVSTVSASETVTYTWDDLGHLAKIATDDVAAAYAYGIDGMRQKKVVDDGTTETTTYSVWSGLNVISELDDDGTRYDYLYGPNSMPLQLVVTASNGTTSTYAYQVDHGGSVIGMTDEDGDEVARYAYDPYGGLVEMSGDPIATRNPLRYRGYYYDNETQLYYLPARYYNPDTARFLSVDPAPPSAGDPTTLNGYAYCVGDPVRHYDPTGAYTDYNGGGEVDAVDYAMRAYILCDQGTDEQEAAWLVAEAALQAKQQFGSSADAADAMQAMRAAAPDIVARVAGVRSLEAGYSGWGYGVLLASGEAYYNGFWWDGYADNGDYVWGFEDVHELRGGGFSLALIKKLRVGAAYLKGPGWLKPSNVTVNGTVIVGFIGGTVSWDEDEGFGSGNGIGLMAGIGPSYLGAAR